MKHIKNLVQVTDEIATSGQPTIEQFRDIAEEGVTAVINLAMHNSDNAIPNEGNVVTSLGTAKLF